MQQSLFLIALACAMILGCTKEDEPKEKVADLHIIATTTPASILKGEEILSKVKCQGPDLCYSLRFDITEVSARQFEIRAKALHRGNVCALALYSVDTIARIQATANGQYLLRFYNANQLVKTDTVQVN